MPTKISLQACHISLYLHELFELILFFDLINYSPWFEGKFWPFLKAIEKESNV